jgi:enoyl-CoA hydratase
MIVREDRGGIRILRLDHGKVSAMDIELCEAIVAELDAARAEAVRGVVITGTGSSFSAGVDLFRIVNDGAAYCERFLPVLDAMLKSALTFPKPLIAAINGHAIAGGCILAAACDRRLMAVGTGRIGVPELVVGVPFPALPLEILSARMSASALRHLVFSGENVLVDVACSIGLVDEKCGSKYLIDRALEVAGQYASVPPRAFAMTKETFYTPILLRVAEMADLNARVVKAWSEPGTHAAIRAYLARTLGKK